MARLLTLLDAPLSAARVRSFYLRGLGVIYLMAFASLAFQIVGLVGSHGVVPAAPFLEAVHAGLGARAVWALPTMAWLSASDAALRFFCGAGMAVSGLLIAGIFPWACCALSWALFLSLVNIGDVFLQYQWESLLLEAGFLALFLAPFTPRLASEAPPRRFARFLHRWLLFRLLFLSGCVKLLSGDPAWRDLTALHFHYETQPLPTPLAWYLEQLPMAWQKLSTGLVFVAELLVPWMVFLSRRPRRIAFAVEASLQALILLTGNYAYFNWLTLLLCVWLLEDGRPEPISTPLGKIERGWLFGIGGWIMLASCVELLSGVVAPSSLLNSLTSLPRHLRWTSGYGLFAVMTTERDEIEIVGSDDGKQWKPYLFRWKPGDVTRGPRFVAPHQPRLDWQAWFAALSQYEREDWLKGLLYRLLQGEPTVLALMGDNPFPDHPPRFVRVQRYRYHFTTSREARATHAWWKRDYLGPYSPVVSLDRSE